MCLTCTSREGENRVFPYTRDNYTFDGLLNVALSRWKQHWLTLALAYAAMVLSVYGPAIVLGVVIGVSTSASGGGRGVSDHAATFVLQVIAQVFSGVVQVCGQLVIFGCCLDVLEQIPLSLGRALARLKALPKLLVQLLLVYAAVAACAGLGFGLYMLVSSLSSALAGAAAVGLLAIPAVPVGIYVSIGLAFMVFELAHNPEATALSALRRSWELAAGRRWSIAGVLFVSGLIGGAGLLLCCIGALASAPLGTLLYAALFLALKQPTASKVQTVTREWPV